MGFKFRTVGLKLLHKFVVKSVGRRWIHVRALANMFCGKLIQGLKLGKDFLLFLAGVAVDFGEHRIELLLQFLLQGGQVCRVVLGDCLLELGSF